MRPVFVKRPSYFFDLDAIRVAHTSQHRDRLDPNHQRATSGRSVVQVVERRIEIPVEKPAPPPARPRHAEWIDVLNELAEQFDTDAGTRARHRGRVGW